MKGSTKQIEWAKNLIDIYRSRIKRFEESIPMEGSQIPVDQKDAVMAAINKTADEMENMDAEDVIALKYLINPFFDRTASIGPHLLKRISANSSNGLMQFAEQKKPPRVDPSTAFYYRSTITASDPESFRISSFSSGYIFA